MTTDPLNEIAVRLGKAEIELFKAKRAEAQALRHLQCVLIAAALFVLLSVVMLLLP